MIPVLTEESSFDLYCKQVAKFPRLTLEEERRLFDQYHNHKCINSMYRIVTSHLKYVIHVAKQYQGYNVSIVDLVQEGNVGLMKAAKTFSPDHGSRFISFAVHRIKEMIFKYVTNNYNLVKFATTKPRHKLFFNRSVVYNKNGQLNDINTIAEQLNVKPVDVRAFVEYNQPLANLYDDDNNLVFEFEDHNNNIAQMVEKEHYDVMCDNVSSALQTLNEREQYIIKSRFLSDKKKTLGELGIELNVSIERVRQIEEQALKRMRGYLDESYQVFA